MSPAKRSTARKPKVSQQANDGERAVGIPTENDDAFTADTSVVARDAEPLAMDERIRARAFEIYQSRDGAAGSAVDDWFAAERELRETPR